MLMIQKTYTELRGHAIYRSNVDIDGELTWVVCKEYHLVGKSKQDKGATFAKTRKLCSQYIFLNQIIFSILTPEEEASLG